MRVNRRFLYSGVFLLAIGGVLVAADLAPALTLRPSQMRCASGRLPSSPSGWASFSGVPRPASPAGMLAAAVPGLVLGERDGRRSAVRRGLRRPR